MAVRIAGVTIPMEKQWELERSVPTVVKIKRVKESKCFATVHGFQPHSPGISVYPHLLEWV